MMNRTLLCSLLLVVCSVLSAQTTKPVTLTNKTPYTDNLTLQAGAETVNVTATLVFDELANTLSLTLKSDHKLFVFWEDVPYRKAFYCHRLRTDRLPYSMTGNTSDQFRRIDYFWRALPKPHNQYVFHQWAVAEGMEPQADEYRTVNDSLCRTFEFPVSCTAVSIRLRDLLTMNEMKRKGISRTYELTYASDPNTLYAITLQRNPCFGLEREIATATNSLSAIRKSYHAFRKIYDGGSVNSEEGQRLFRELKEALCTQFPAINDSNACPDIQIANKLYNQVADSISQMEVKLVDIPSELLTKGEALNAKTVLLNSRTLDSNVNRWLKSTDEMERTDLINQSLTIIRETSIMIDNSVLKTPEDHNAVSLFQKAEQYFMRTCK